jgi:hypothetical protein
VAEAGDEPAFTPRAKAFPTQSWHASARRAASVPRTVQRLSAIDSATIAPCFTAFLLPLRAPPPAPCIRTPQPPARPTLGTATRSTSISRDNARRKSLFLPYRFRYVAGVSGVFAGVSGRSGSAPLRPLRRSRDRHVSGRLWPSASRLNTRIVQHGLAFCSRASVNLGPVARLNVFEQRRPAVRQPAILAAILFSFSNSVRLASPNLAHILDPLR